MVAPVCGLRPLRAFRCDRASLGNAELVRRTGLPKATVSRLTTTLLQVGFLRHVAGGSERTGCRIVNLRFVGDAPAANDQDSSAAQQDRSRSDDDQRCVGVGFAGNGAAELIAGRLSG